MEKRKFCIFKNKKETLKVKGSYALLLFSLSLINFLKYSAFPIVFSLWDDSCFKLLSSTKFGDILKHFQIEKLTYF